MKHGAFGWTELATSDLPAAEKFYTSLFGWETEQGPVEGVEYKMVKVGGVAMGGMMKIPEACEGNPPAWTVYVTVDDVDAVAEKAEKLGGKVIHPPMDIPDVGRMCAIQDPQGAVISAITYLKTS